MTTLDTLFDVLIEKGSERYGSEAINQLQHALQCATLAERSGASSALITAALFLDIGHLIRDDEGAAERGIDLRHEDSGSETLGSLFGEDVCEPVRLHVDAKRYLCAVNPKYYDTLSQGSITSLKVQGGIMSTEEAETFAASPHGKHAAALRVWDDRAKDPSAETPDLSYFRQHAENALIQTRA